MLITQDDSSVALQSAPFTNPDTMTCPACGHDRYRQCRGPEKFETFEIRKAECLKCGLQFFLRTIIETVLVLNPITLEREEISVTAFDERIRDYVLGRGHHPKQRRD